MLIYAKTKLQKEFEEGKISPEEKSTVLSSKYNNVLNRYFGQPNIYITFSNVLRFGFNPRSEFDTPFGIYAYPLNKLWLANPPNFATDREYIHIFRNLGKTLNLNEYSDSDLKKHLEIIKSFYDINNFDSLLKETSNIAKVKSPAGILWDFTRLLSDVTNRNVPQDEIVDYQDSKEWSRILSKLGYNCIVDYGQSIIHESEPTQALFLVNLGLSNLEYIDTLSSNEDKISNFIDSKSFELIENKDLDFMKKYSVNFRKNKFKDFDQETLNMLFLAGNLDQQLLSNIIFNNQESRSKLIELAESGNELAARIMLKDYNHYSDFKESLIKMISNKSIPLKVFFLKEKGTFDNLPNPYKDFIINLIENDKSDLIKSLNEYLYKDSIISLAKKNNKKAISLLDPNDPDMKEVVDILGLKSQAYFQGTEKPKKYKVEKSEFVNSRFKDPFYKNYDLYEFPDDKIGPGAGFYQNMHKYKSVKDFLNKKRKKRKNKKIARRMLLLTSLIKNGIDFKTHDQIENQIPWNSGSYSDAVQMGGNLDEYLPYPDFEDKTPDKLNFGRDYSIENINALQEILDDLLKGLNPKETDLYGLPDGILDKEDLDNPSNINSYYGTTDSGNTLYSNVWFL